jgi:hypothetical protein
LFVKLESNRNQATESKPTKHPSITRNYSYGINPSIHLSEPTQEPDKSQTRRTNLGRLTAPHAPRIRIQETVTQPHRPSYQIKPRRSPRSADLAPGGGRGEGGGEGVRHTSLPDRGRRRESERLAAASGTRRRP